MFKVVAITGASSGIGLACARLIARKGCAVVLSARRADKLAEAVTAIEADGGRALAVAGDVTVDEDMRALVAKTVEKFGRLDAMICNAGIGFHGALEDTPADVMRRLLDVNVIGTFHAARAAYAVFRAQGSGHIIAMSSIAGQRGIAGMSAYSATKAAQVGFIEALRTEFVGTKIHASVVYPVSVPTEFHDAMRRDFGHAESGAGPKQSADDVARAVMACLERPRAEVYPYPRSRWLAILNVLAPARADRLVKKFGRRR